MAKAYVMSKSWKFHNRGGGGGGGINPLLTGRVPVNAWACLRNPVVRGGSVLVSLPLISGHTSSKMVVWRLQTTLLELARWCGDMASAHAIHDPSWAIVYVPPLHTP